MRAEGARALDQCTARLFYSIPRESGGLERCRGENGECLLEKLRKEGNLVEKLGGKCALGKFTRTKIPLK
jgi:hypothetical protein